MNLTIMRLIIANIFIGAVVLAVVSFVAVKGQQENAEISAALYKHPFMVTNAVKNIKDDVKTIHSLVDEVIAHGADLDETAAKIAVLEISIQKNVETAKSLYLGDKKTAIDAEVKTKEILRFAKHVIETAQREGLKAAEAHHEDWRAVEYSLFESIDKMINFAMEHAGKYAEQIKNNSKNSQQQFVSIVAVFAAIAFLAALFTVRALRGELRSIGDFLVDIKNGTYKNIEVSKNELYEFKELKHGLNLMVDGIAKSREELQDAHDEAIALNEKLMENARELEEVNTEMEVALEQAKIANEMLSVQSRELEEKNVELKEGEESYKGLFNAIRHAIYIQDLDGTFLAVNNGAEEMYGYKNEEFIGKNPLFVSAEGKNDLEDLGRRIRAAIDGRPQRFEFWGRRKNGEEFPKDLSIVRGKYFGQDVLIAIASDITKQKRLENDLQTMVAEETDRRLEKERMLAQQSKLAMMGEMIGNIAHQWRQPLNALAIKVQDVPIALEVGDLDEKYALDFKNGSMALINYMSGTIDDFRSFFKPDKQKIRFALKNTVEKACVLIKDSLHFSFIELEVLPIDESVYAYGYPNEFSQVLLNILSNAKDALKANTTMGSDKRITVSFALSDGFARLSVSDNAGGIDEAIMDKVFDPYFTTKHQGQGTGLGLYMSKMIVEQNMGGTLTVENRGDGACFTVSLPTSGKAESLQD